MGIGTGQNPAYSRVRHMVGWDHELVYRDMSCLEKGGNSVSQSSSVFTTSPSDPLFDVLAWLSLGPSISWTGQAGLWH